MKVKYSLFLADARGKLNGSVAAKNRYGQYFRNKVTPVNPQTIAQVKQRSLLAQFSQQWRTLSQLERDSWKGAVDSWTRTNIFGDVVTPSANILYNRLNMNIAIAGGTPITLPPAPTGVETPTALSVDYDSTAGTLEMAFAPSTVDADLSLIIEATDQMSPGVSYMKNKFRQIAVKTSVTASPIDIIADYVAKFGEPTEGLRAGFRISFVSKTTGEKSQAISVSLIF